MSSETLSQELEERPVTEYVEVIQEVAWNETQQVQKQMISPSRSVLRGSMRCGHENRSACEETRERAQTTIEVVIPCGKAELTP